MNRARLSLSLSLSLSLLILFPAPAGARQCAPTLRANFPAPTDRPIYQPSPPPPGQPISNQRESRIVVNPTDPLNWIAIFMDDYLDPQRQFDGMRPPGTVTSLSRIRVSRSLDFGTTWTTTAAMPATFTSEEIDFYDPDVAFDLLGRPCIVYVERKDRGTATQETRLIARHSADKGATWPTVFILDCTGPPSSCPGGTGASPFAFLDSPKLAAADPLSSCVNCATDIPCLLYVAWSKVLPNPSPTPGGCLLSGDIRFGLSSDGGVTWTNIQTISDRPTSCSNYVVPAIATSGNKVYVGWLEYVSGARANFITDSSGDCGVTFGADSSGFNLGYIPRYIGPYAQCGAGKEIAATIPVMGAVGNWLFVVWPDYTPAQCLPPNPTPPRIRVVYNSSSNQGLPGTWTWTSAYPEVDPTGTSEGYEQFAPAISVFPGSTTAYVTFWDKRTDPASPPLPPPQKKFDLFGTMTHCLAPGGPIPWSTTVQVSSATSDPWYGQTSPASFFGDYNGLVLLALNVAIATFTDCRSPAPSPPPNSWQDIWWNYYYVYGQDSGGQSSPSSISASQGGTLVLSFQVPPERVGASYRICAGQALSPSRLVGRRWVPVARDELAIAVESGEGLLARNFTGMVGSSGVVTATLELAPFAPRSSNLHFALVAGEHGEYLSPLVSVRVEQ